MNIYLSARSNKPGAAEVVLLNGMGTAYAIGEGADWGIPSWEKFYSGMRGTQGARLAGAEAQNRTLTLPFKVRGADHDELERRLAVLWQLDDELRRFGGWITWRPNGGSFKVRYEVFDSSIRIDGFGRLFHHYSIIDVTLAPVCGPYLLGEPYDIFDAFSTDSGADWTRDADAAALKILGGQLVPSTTGTSRWRHTGRGYEYGDVEVTLKIQTGSTVAAYSADVYLNGSTAAAETFFSAQLQGGNLNVAKWDAGSNTWPATVAFAYAANSTYWLRVRREGRRMTASVYTSEPTPISTPAATTSYTLTVTENWAYASGHTGFRLAVVATTERYDDFRAEPFTYTSAASFA